MHVIIVLDLSSSTTPFLDSIRKAALEFVKILRPEDRCILVGFEREMKVLSEMTSDQQKLTEALKKTKTIGSGGSNMQDILYEMQTKQL